MDTFKFTKVDPCVCVYKLWADNRVGYIGKTNNLRSRLNAHKANTEGYSWKNLINAISYIPVPNELDACILELLLINTLSPEFNKDNKFNVQTSFDINLSDLTEYRLITDEKGVIYAKENIETKEILHFKKDKQGSFYTLCKTAVEGTGDIENIYNLYPLIKEAITVLGKERLKKLCYNITLVTRELADHSKLPLLKLEADRVFEKGKFYESKDVKVLLSKLYRDLGIKRTAKAIDIKLIYEIKETRKLLGTKKATGYQF